MKENITIFIDADGCPVIDNTIKISKEFDMKVIIISDTCHIINKDNIETIIVSKGKDAVDFVLINKVSKHDIVITQDYGLAAMVLSKQAYPINQNGLIYNNDNIEQLLFSRHISQKARKSGQRVKGPKKRTREDNEYFEEKLRTLIKSIKNGTS